MDEIAGQTTEDTEILDARVDAKGVKHPNLGHNVRTLHSEVMELDESVKYGINEFRGLIRQFNELAYAQVQSELNTREAHERRKAELAHETQARTEADGLCVFVVWIAVSITEALRQSCRERSLIADSL